MLLSPCVTVGGAGRTLPGELESTPSLTVVGSGDVAWKNSNDSGCTCKVFDMRHLDLYEIALSNVDV